MARCFSRKICLISCLTVYRIWHVQLCQATEQPIFFFLERMLEACKFNNNRINRLCTNHVVLLCHIQKLSQCVQKIQAWELTLWGTHWKTEELHPICQCLLCWALEAQATKGNTEQWEFIRAEDTSHRRILSGSPKASHGTGGHTNCASAEELTSTTYTELPKLRNLNKWLKMGIRFTQTYSRM